MNSIFATTDSSIVRLPMFSFDKTITGLSSRREFIKTINDPLFKEAILYASPSLFKELNKFLSNNLSEKERLRMERTLTKYLIRMGFRSTPFALFSLCGIGFFGDKTSIAKPVSFRIERNLDFEFKNIIYNDNLKQLCLDFNINFITNQTVRTYRNSIVFQGRNAKGHHQKYVLYPSSIIEEIIGFYSIPKSFKDGYKYLSKEYEISVDDYYQLVQNLSDTMILIPEFVSDLLPTFPKMNSDENLINTYFSNCKLLFSSKDNLTPKYMDDTYEILNQLSIDYKKINIKNILKVNTYLNKSTIIYQGIKTCLQKALQLFCTLTPPRSTSLSNFIRKFRERYENEPVLLLEALDPNAGIGYGRDLPGGEHSLLQELKAMKSPNKQLQNISIVLTPYEQIVANKLHSKSYTDGDIISLTDKDFPILKSDQSISYPSMSCMYKYVGRRNGKDIISDLQFTGPTACRMISRFSNECAEFNDLCDDICKREEAINKDVLYCEISHLPKDHVGNILARPCWRESVCYYMTYPKYSSDKVIEVKLADLYLKFDGGKLIIWSKSLDKQIIPRITSAYNHYYETTPLYQFLGDMQTGGINENMSLSTLNLLQVNHYIPRVEYKNIVLSKRTWILKNEYLEKSYNNDLKAYINYLNFPRFISYTERDNQLVFDIQSELCLNVLMEIIQSQKDIVIEEFLPLLGEFESSEYNVEIITPLIKS